MFRDAEASDGADFSLVLNIFEQWAPVEMSQNSKDVTWACSRTQISPPVTTLV